MNKNLLWVYLFQIFKLLNGLIPILLLPIFLDPIDQGLWFLILSFGSIILLFSVSQNHIALIFGAHEFKELKFIDFNVFGKTKNIESLYAFIVYSNVFFIKVLITMSVVVTFLFYVYIDEGASSSIIYIFIMYIMGLFLYALSFSFLSYIESFNQVLYSYQYKTLIIASISILMILFLILEFKLLSLALATFCSMFFWFLFFSSKVVKFFQFNKFSNLNFSRKKKKIFFNYFIKNSFSMISGFLLFQIYTPMVYYYYGSVFSGRVGLSIAIMTALFAVSTAVLNIKLPKVTQFIALKKYREAYDIYFKTSYYSILIFLFFLFIGLYLLYNIDIFSIYQKRVVSLESFLILSCAWFLQLIVYILVTFIRLFKRELFVLPTIVSSIYIFVSTIIILKYFPNKYLFMGLLSSYIFGLPWIYKIYRNFLKGKV